MPTESAFCSKFFIWSSRYSPRFTNYELSLLRNAGYSGVLYHVTLISSSSSFSVCSSGLWGLVRGLTSLKSSLGRSPSASLRSGLGLFLFGNVCSREPPVASSSRSLLFRHFMRRFWNQIFTCESLRPSFSASFLRSGLLMYFCIWNLFSSPRRWRSEKTALLIIPRRGFPRAFVAHGKTKPVPEKSPILPWIAPGNTAPPPGVPGWWLPVPEPATVRYGPL